MADDSSGEPSRFIAARELEHSLRTLRDANMKLETEKTELKSKLEAIEKMGKEAKEKAGPWNVVIIIIVVFIFLAFVSQQCDGHRPY
jgi:hypothetical protein